MSRKFTCRGDCFYFVCFSAWLFIYVWTWFFQNVLVGTALVYLQWSNTFMSKSTLSWWRILRVVFPKLCQCLLMSQKQEKSIEQQFWGKNTLTHPVFFDCTFNNVGFGGANRVVSKSVKSLNRGFERKPALLDTSETKKTDWWHRSWRSYKAHLGAFALAHLLLALNVTAHFFVNMATLPVNLTSRS